MIALKEFRYTDQATQRQVTVQRGQEISGELLAAHKCDVAKLVRVKLLDESATRADSPKKRRIRQPR